MEPELAEIRRVRLSAATFELPGQPERPDVIVELTVGDGPYLMFTGEGVRVGFDPTQLATAYNLVLGNPVEPPPDPEP